MNHRISHGLKVITLVDELLYCFAIWCGLSTRVNEISVKFQSKQTILKPNITSSKLCKILWQDFLMDIETGPWRFYITKCLVDVDSQHRAFPFHDKVIALKTHFVSKCDFHNEVQSCQSSMLEEMVFICAIAGDGICPIKCAAWYLPHVKCMYIWLMHWRYLSFALSQQYVPGKPLIASYWFVLNTQQFKVMGQVLFHKGLMSSLVKSCENFLCCNYHYDYPIRSQICTCHGSWAFFTWAKLWLNHITIFQVRITRVYFHLDCNSIIPQQI